MSDETTAPTQGQGSMVSPEELDRAAVAGGEGARSAAERNIRGDLSAATVGRMMGLATAAELKVLEGKLDVLSTKFNSFAVKLDRAVTLLNSTPTGSDLERVEIQISTLRTFLKDVMNRPAEEDGEKKA